MILNGYYRLNPDVLLQQIDEDTVLLNSINREFHTLNATALQFWNVLQDEKDLQRVYEILLERFEVSEKQLQEDLDNFVTALQEKGLMEMTELAGK